MTNDKKPKDINDLFTINNPKKPEHILAFRSDFVNLAMNNQGIDPSISNVLLKDVNLKRDFPNESVFFGMRDALENMPFFRHPIFYITLEYQGKIAIYKRLDSGGEEKLHNMHSIGFGGHVDLEDTIHENSVVDAEKTIELSATRELAEELSLPFDPNDAEVITRGYIIDNRDEVGRVHLGIWQSLIVPEGVDLNDIDISDKEKYKMEFLGFYDRNWFKENIEAGMQVEGWSDIILRNY